MSYILEEDSHNTCNQQKKTIQEYRTSNQVDKKTHIMGNRTEQTSFNKEDIKMANMKGCSVVNGEM